MSDMINAEYALEQSRNARRTRVEHEGKTFIVRRPTDAEAAEIARTGKSQQMDLLEKFVEGWEGIKGIDVFPGGDSTPVAFSRELFVDWVSDNPQYWGPLSSAIHKEYESHAEKLIASLKK